MINKLLYTVMQKICFTYIYTQLGDMQQNRKTSWENIKWLFLKKHYQSLIFVMGNSYDFLPAS